MSYVYGLSIINTHLYNGATIVLNKYSVIEREFWNKVQNYKVTNFGGVPFTYSILNRIDLNKFNVPKIFKWIQNFGITQSEMLKTFNCGYGMVVILKKSKLNKFKNLMKKHKLDYDKIGVLLNSKKSEKRIKFIGKLNFDD